MVKVRVLAVARAVPTAAEARLLALVMTLRRPTSPIPLPLTIQVASTTL